MMGLTRGRAWIGLLSVLLAGIVALNVLSLSLSASQGKIAEQTQTLAQENSALRARLAQRLSNDRVETAAASLGMAVPEPGAISYRDASGRAVQTLVERLASGFGSGASLVETPAPTTTTIPVATDTAAPATTPAAPADATTTSAPATSTTTAPATQPAPIQPAPVTGTGGGVSPG
jgi:hypothetical protein